MENPDIEVPAAKPIRRFASYEEFLNAFYPETAKQEAAPKELEEQDFGTNLAIESLNRHAEILKF